MAYNWVITADHIETDEVGTTGPMGPEGSDNPTPYQWGVA